MCQGKGSRKEGGRERERERERERKLPAAGRNSAPHLLGIVRVLAFQISSPTLVLNRDAPRLEGAPRCGSTLPTGQVPASHAPSTRVP